MTARRLIECPREPIGLSAEESGVYLGMSPTLFLKMVAEGKMPAPRCAGRRRIWDVQELNNAFRQLPRDLSSPGNSSQDDAEPDDPWSRARA